MWASQEFPCSLAAAILKGPTLPEQDTARSGRMVKFDQHRPAEPGPANPPASYVETEVDPGPAWGRSGSLPAPAAIYKGSKTAGASVENWGRKTAHQAKSTSGIKLLGDYPHQEKRPLWSSPMSQGCHATHSRHTPSSDTILHLLQQYSLWGRSLPTSQLLQAALRGPLKAHVVAAYSDSLQEASAVICVLADSTISAKAVFLTKATASHTFPINKETTKTK